MSWTIDLVPMVPAPLLWAAGLVAAVLVGAMFLRRTRGAAMRALALAAMLAALLNPTLRQEERESLANIAIAVIDESASQSLAGRPAQTAAIKADLEAKLAAIPGLEVKWVSASRPTGEAGAGTILFTDLNRALANIPTDRLSGIIMITDGQVHDAPKTAADLGFDAPVHTLLTGRPGEFDRRIEVISAPKFGVVKQERDVEVVVREHGRSQGAGDQVQLKIRREGRPDEIVRTRIGQRVKTRMPFPHGGQNIMEIDLEPVPGELTIANNRVVIVAEGVRDNLRVLLVSGEPHAGERTWRNLLKSDAAVDLVHFTILRPPEKQDDTPIHQLSLIQFPTRELFSERINDFDLIIFDRYQHRGILQIIYYDNIAQYVTKHGGALLIAAGDDYAGRTSLYATPLRTVLPAQPTGRVVEQPFRARSTKDGVRHPVTAGLTGASETNPTWGRWLRQVEARLRDTKARVLLNGVGDNPLLVLDRKGKGRVALMLSDHAWLWARGFDGGGPHTDLLRRLSHWLMKEPELEEERLIATAKGFRISLERRSMDETVPPIIMSAPGGEQVTITPEKAGDGIWRAAADVKLPGLYKFQSGDLTAVAHAGIEDAREMSDVVATEERMRPIADATGAGIFWTRGGGLLSSATGVDVPRVSLIANARHLAGSGWMGLRDREAYVTRGVKLTPMFTGLAALSALLMLIALAWWREGR